MRLRHPFYEEMPDEETVWWYRRAEHYSKGCKMRWLQQCYRDYDKEYEMHYGKEYSEYLRNQYYNYMISEQQRLRNILCSILRQYTI